jgi:hypothetical protein
MNETRSMNHAPKFKVGQLVVYFPPRGLNAAEGAYRVTAVLPPPTGEFEYHIKHPSEVHERVVAESQLSELWANE